MSSVVSSKITGKEYPLSKIFSSDFEYHIPATSALMHGRKMKRARCSMIYMDFSRQRTPKISFWAASSLSRMNRTAMPMSSMDSSA